MKIFSSLIVVLASIHWLQAQQSYLHQARQLNSEGTALFLAGDYPTAQKKYTEELRVYVNNKDYLHASEAYSNVAVALFYQRDFAAAVQRCKTGLKLIENMPNDTVAFRHYKFLGLFYNYLYKKDSSLFFYEKAEKLVSNSKLLKNNSEIISFYENQGVDLSKLGYFREAESYFKKAQQSAHLDPLYDKGTLFANIGNLYLLQKKYKDAKQSYEYALTQTTRQGNQSAILLRLSNSEFYLGNVADAQKHLSKSFWVYKQSKTSPDLEFEAAYFHSQGLIFAKKGKYQEAEKSYQKAVRLNQSQSSRSLALSSVLISYAQLYDIQTQLPKALENYQKAIIASHTTFDKLDIYQNPSLNKILTERELFKALIGKATSFKKYYFITKNYRELKTALQTYQLAIRLAEKMRISYQSSNAKLFFTEAHYEVYEQGVETAQMLYELTKNKDYQELLFDFYEKSRAAALSDAIREDKFKPKTIPATLLAYENALFQQTSGLQLAIKRADSTKIPKLHEQLTDKEIELMNLTKRFEREYPAYFKLKYASISLPINELRKKLVNPQNAIIQYFMGDNSLYILLLTDQTQKTYRITIDSTFKNRLNEFRLSISTNPQSRVFKGGANSKVMYQYLIAPIEHDINNKKNLIVIRDSELNFIPFEVLSKNGADFLVQKYALSYGYSVGLLLSSIEKKSNRNVVAFAPFVKKINSKKDVFRGDPLVQLPASEQEVKQIGGDIYLEKEATKKRFLEQYRSHGIIHFATHALTNDQDPLSSFIAFYPDGQEYRLFTDELYDLDLTDAKLVVLSACETGRGQLRKGEGVMSLARAFSYAGATTVTTTLWNANDETTAYISTQFHEYINNGMQLDEALQQAKLDFLSSSLARQYDHPYYWANMVLIGSSNAIETGYSVWWWVGISLLLGWGIWRLKK
ncbi:MAG: CHAT domain-containing protein [Spirosomataceae bacterium]